MPGINLSQSAQKKEIEKYDSFGKGMYFTVGVLIFIVAIWVGLVFYEKKLVGSIVTIQGAINENRQYFSGNDLNDVADFQYRLDLISKNLDEQIYPSDMLRSLESVILPAVVLSQYEFDAKTSSVAIKGSADSFRSVVQQMVLMKRLPNFQSLSVKNVSHANSGGVDFEFLLTLSK